MSVTHEKIIDKLLRNTVVESNERSIDTIVNWFPKDERDDARELLIEIIDDSSYPVEGDDDPDNGGDKAVYITDPDALRENRGIDSWLL